MSKEAKSGGKVNSGNLEDQPWYHGYRPRRDCQNLLKDSGDWLVRASDNNAGFKAEIIISVLDHRRNFQNLTLANDNGKWHLTVIAKSKKPQPSFASVSELVQHYQEKALGKLQLKKAVNRPNWLLKHSMIQYDKTKDLLGSGNFCDVFKGKFERERGDFVDVAIKICHGAEDQKVLEEAATQRKNMLHEAELMSYYSHENVIQLFGVACDHPPIVIVMEFCPGGNLQDHLQKQKEKITTGERILYLYEASLGMRYLHHKKCIHRDLAARNCLISDKGSVKISDFGLSKMAEDITGDKQEKEKEEEPPAQMPLRWMAPESLKKPRVFTTKSDVWSFGVLTYEVYNEGIKPWANDDQNKRIATNIRKGNMPELPKNTPEELKVLVQKMWSLDPDLRPTMSEMATKLYKLSKEHPVKEFVIRRRMGPPTHPDDTEKTKEEKAAGEGSGSGTGRELKKYRKPKDRHSTPIGDQLGKQSPMSAPTTIRSSHCVEVLSKSSHNFKKVGKCVKSLAAVTKSPEMKTSKLLIKIPAKNKTKSPREKKSSSIRKTTKITSGAPKKMSYVVPKQVRKVSEVEKKCTSAEKSNTTTSKEELSRDSTISKETTSREDTTTFADLLIARKKAESGEKETSKEENPSKDNTGKMDGGLNTKKSSMEASSGEKSTSKEKDQPSHRMNAVKRSSKKSMCSIESVQSVQTFSDESQGSEDEKSAEENGKQTEHTEEEAADPRDGPSTVRKAPEGANVKTAGSPNKGKSQSQSQTQTND